MTVNLSELEKRPPIPELTPEDEAALAAPFVQALARLIRAQDTFGAYGKISDAQLLARFIVTKEQRRAAAQLCRADPELVWRIEQYYGAVGLLVEQETGLVASPMLKFHEEGFGRIILLVGKLVALSKHLRDAQRFGFDSFAALAAEGAKQAADAIATIRRFPEVANA